MPFNEIKGQEIALNYLKNIIIKKRIPPTLMFVGKNGTGRFLTAIAFAETLNCKNFEENGKRCIASVKNGVHPNVKIIGRNSSVGINDIRGIINESFAPIEGGYKVNIIDNADMSSIQAFNSMLKYFEEPPDSTVNILIVNDIFNVPETIRSRSVVVKFYPLSPKVIEEFLISKGLDKEKAVLVSHLLNGSLEHWEEFSDDTFLKNRKLFIESLLLFFQGRNSTVSVLEKWANLFPDLSPPESAERFFDYILALIEDILHVSVISEKENISNIDFLGYIADKFAVANKNSLERIFTIMKEQKKALLTNANPRYIMLDGILRMKEVIV